MNQPKKISKKLQYRAQKASKSAFNAKKKGKYNYAEAVSTLVRQSEEEEA